MPRSRKASTLSLMNLSSSASKLASVWAMKLVECCCTSRYSVVCSGRCRSHGLRRPPALAWVAGQWWARWPPERASPHGLEPCPA